MKHYLYFKDSIKNICQIIWVCHQVVSTKPIWIKNKFYLKKKKKIIIIIQEKMCKNYEHHYRCSFIVPSHKRRHLRQDVSNIYKWSWIVYFVSILYSTSNFSSHGWILPILPTLQKCSWLIWTWIKNLWNFSTKVASFSRPMCQRMNIERNHEEGYVRIFNTPSVSK